MRGYKHVERGAEGVFSSPACRAAGLARGRARTARGGGATRRARGGRRGSAPACHIHLGASVGAGGQTCIHVTPLSGRAWECVVGGRERARPGLPRTRGACNWGGPPRMRPILLLPRARRDLLEVEVEPPEAPRHQQLPLLRALRQPEECDAVEQIVPRAPKRRAAQRLGAVDGADRVAQRRSGDEACEGVAAAEAAAVRGGKVERGVVGGRRLAPRACVCVGLVASSKPRGGAQGQKSPWQGSSKGWRPSAQSEHGGPQRALDSRTARRARF